MSYYVPLENVCNRDKQDIRTMIDLGRYFSIFAPRQSGKTTFLRETCKKLHADPTYVAIVLGFQEYKELDKKQFYDQVQHYLYSQLLDRLKEVGCEKLEAVSQFLNRHPLTNHISFKLFFQELNRLIRFKKIVVFIDEFDGIPTGQLANFLTSLRELYQDYKNTREKALYSVGLIGIRNVTKLVVGGVSPFNIADQVTLPPFSPKNIGDLYRQHTEETNQPFNPEAAQRIFDETAGQPWLVNRLGSILTRDIKPGTVEPVTLEDVEKAVQHLLKEKNDHFDNLYEKAKLYKETFVEIVFDHTEYDPDDEHQDWLEQYGLIKKSNGGAVVANNIYKSRFVKTFFKESRAYREISPGDYMLPGDGGDRLDMNRVLLDFNRYINQVGVQAFYKKQKPYEKTGQFLLTAWLYQFVRDGRGDLRYELPTGLGRLDIMLTYKGRKYIIETKVNRYSDIAVVVEEGAAQLSKKYLATEAVSGGYLVIFDARRPVGAVCKPQEYKAEGCTASITVFTINIGRPV